MGKPFGLADGSPVPFQAQRTALRSEPAADIAAVQLDNNENAFGIIASDGTPLSKVNGEFLGFAGSTVAQLWAVRTPPGRGSVAGVGPNGSARWEQPVTFDAPDVTSTTSFSNGSVWVRNASNELTAIDVSSGEPEPRRSCSRPGTTIGSRHCALSPGSRARRGV